MPGTTTSASKRQSVSSSGTSGTSPLSASGAVIPFTSTVEPERTSWSCGRKRPANCTEASVRTSVMRRFASECPSPGSIETRTSGAARSGFGLFTGKGRQKPTSPSKNSTRCGRNSSTSINARARLAAGSSPRIPRLAATMSTIPCRVEAPRRSTWISPVSRSR